MQNILLFLQSESDITVMFSNYTLLLRQVHKIVKSDY